MEASNEKSWPVPSNEPERVQELRSYNLVGSPKELEYDRIVATIKRLFDVPIALISLIEDDFQWFKAKDGLEVCETSREVSFCAHAIMEPQTFIVENALEDVRFKDNPLVVGPPYIRFYAGVPLITPNGACIGTVCAIDTVPRKVTQKQIETLGATSRLVMRFLEARKVTQGAFRYGTSLEELTNALS